MMTKDAVIWNIPKMSVPLHRVFHSIRFKVNKVGVQRYSFFIYIGFEIFVFS